MPPQLRIPTTGLNGTGLGVGLNSATAGGSANGTALRTGLVPRQMAANPIKALDNLRQIKKEVSYSACVGFGDNPDACLIPYNAESISPDWGLVHPWLLSMGITVAEDTMSSATGRALLFLQTFGTILSDLWKRRQSIRQSDQQSLLNPWDSDVKAQLTICQQYLVDCHGISVSTGNCIRRLSADIETIRAQLDNLRSRNPDIGDSTIEDMAFEQLIDAVEHMKTVSIHRASDQIIARGAAKIREGDVVLTYGASRLVRGVLVAAKNRIMAERLCEPGVDQLKAQLIPAFEVIVLDSRPRQQAYSLALALSKEGIPVTYGLHTALLHLFPRVTKVLSAAYALLANGSLLGRAGTALVASVAQDFRVPFIVLSESLKFYSKTYVGSTYFNELLDPMETVSACSHAEEENVKSLSMRDFGGFGGFGRGASVPLSPASSPAGAGERRTPRGDNGAQSSGADEIPYPICSLAYDVTPAELISVIITDSADIPPSSVPAIVKQRDESYFNPRRADDE